jgi:hypothetical protein
LEDLVKIELFGELHTFKSEKDVQDAEAIAELIIQEVSDIESSSLGQTVRSSRFKQLLLATMNISSKYYKLKRDHDEAMKNITDKSAAIIKSIEKKCSTL